MEQLKRKNTRLFFICLIIASIGHEIALQKEVRIRYTDFFSLSFEAGRGEDRTHKRRRLEKRGYLQILRMLPLNALWIKSDYYTVCY